MNYFKVSNITIKMWDFWRGPGGEDGATSLLCTDKSKQKAVSVWRISLISQWYKDVYNEPLEFETVPSDVLAIFLRKLYCEAKPKESSSRKEKHLHAQAEHYHKNTLKNLRSALNSHLQDLGRNIDIVRNKEFKSANHALDGMMKVMTKTGASRATQHKSVITSDDLKKNYSYFQAAWFSP